MQPGCLLSRTRHLSRQLPALAIATVLLAGCAGLGSNSADPKGGSSAGTVWLCRPGTSNDPCAGSLRTTVVQAAGQRTVEGRSPDLRSKFDCFYIYPTVSKELSDNSDLAVQKEEVASAKAQAAQFSSVCRVWAPMYRQRTALSLLLHGLGGDPQGDEVAYQSLLQGWRHYLAQDNHGRPVIFIGHSQGAAMLIRLLRSQVDDNPGLRHRTVLAMILGGNVTVPRGKIVGQTFKHLPLCTKDGEVGCVIAYSSFPSRPPSNSNFGRPGQGVSLQSGQRQRSGVAVACVNPAALTGGEADLLPYFPSSTSSPSGPAVTTPWVTYPDLYRAGCRSQDGATWLQVTKLQVGVRPTVSASLGPQWGYHLDDVNLALGNLVQDVAKAETAFTRKSAR